MLQLGTTYKAEIEAIARDPEVFPVIVHGCWGSEVLDFASDIAQLTFVQTLIDAIFAEDLVALVLNNITIGEYALQNITVAGTELTNISIGETQLIQT